MYKTNKKENVANMRKNLKLSIELLWDVSENQENTDKVCDLYAKHLSYLPSFDEFIADLAEFTAELKE